VSAPLEGVLVVALEQAVAAPMASARLAEAGARVIKVERPEGDFARGYDTAAAGTASYFAWLNAGKESVALDLRDPADMGLMRRMVARADVFLQNLAVGAAERLGLGQAALRAGRPGLVTCAISGYGAQGPYAGMKAYDLLVQAESGLISVSGVPGSYGRIGVSVADIATGTNAALAISQALLRRFRTGEGAHLELSLFATMADWMTVPLLNHEAGRSPGQAGLAHPSIAPYGAFPTADGGLILISVQSDREWRTLAAAMGREALGTDPRFATNAARVENRAETDAAVAAWMAGLRRAEAGAALRQARIAFGALNDVSGLAAHPALVRRAQPVPGGVASLPEAPVRADWIAPRPVPALDEHGAAIRAEFAAD
jgi:crotonobetainyl-CoA:carnitine CoA-transferase CaiB-like acyl-CoA transferase